MRVAMNEQDIPDRGGCGNEGVHCGEAFLAGLPDLPRTRGGIGREGFDGNELRNFFPVRFKRGFVAERPQARPEFDFCDAGNRWRVAVVLKKERNLIRSRLVKIIGDDGRAIEEVGHWEKLYEFPSALSDQLSDWILPFGEKMATAPPKRLDRLLT